MLEHDEVPCPHCGEAIHKDATHCPHCGSDEETGWQPEDDKFAAQVDYSFTHLEDEAYGDFLRSEGLGDELEEIPRDPLIQPTTSGPPLFPLLLVLFFAALAGLIGLLS